VPVLVPCSAVEVLEVLLRFWLHLWRYSFFDDDICGNDVLELNRADNSNIWDMLFIALFRIDVQMSALSGL
jgi:hypothetical protein